MVHLLGAHVKLAERLIREPGQVQFVAAWSGVQADVLLSNQLRGQYIHRHWGTQYTSSISRSIG